MVLWKIKGANQLYLVAFISLVSLNSHLSPFDELQVKAFTKKIASTTTTIMNNIDGYTLPLTHFLGRPDVETKF